MENKSNSFSSLPGAIIIAGVIISMAIIYTKKPVANIAPVTDTTEQQATVAINLSPVTSKDHILGNPNAKLKIVEYSDPSCPYCKSFNQTMVDIMNQYGPGGNVAWVYRSFPLDTPDANGNILHPNADNESRALDCVASLAGNDKFWQFEKQMYSISGNLDQKLIPLMAKDLGIDVSTFNECLSSPEIGRGVRDDALSGTNAGVSGTPTSFFVLNQPISPTALKYIASAQVQYRIPAGLIYVSSDNKIISMSGAMPKALIAGIIDNLLK